MRINSQTIAFSIKEKLNPLDLRITRQIAKLVQHNPRASNKAAPMPSRPITMPRISMQSIKQKFVSLFKGVKHQNPTPKIASDQFENIIKTLNNHPKKQVNCLHQLIQFHKNDSATIPDSLNEYVSDLLKDSIKDNLLPKDKVSELSDMLREWNTQFNNHIATGEYTPSSNYKKSTHT